MPATITFNDATQREIFPWPSAVSGPVIYLIVGNPKISLANYWQVQCFYESFRFAIVGR
jgi:hypothetical protein